MYRTSKAGFRKFSESQAGFETTFKVTLGYQGLSECRNKLSEVGYWKNFTISKWFHRTQQKLHFGFPSQKDNWKLWKPYALFQKVPTVLILGPSKKIFISWYYPFKETDLFSPLDQVAQSLLQSQQALQLSGQVAHWPNRRGRCISSSI